MTAEKTYKEVYVTGKYESMTLFEVADYGDGKIVAAGDGENVTDGQILKAFAREFPGVQLKVERSKWGVRVWTV